MDHSCVILLDLFHLTLPPTPRALPVGQRNVGKVRTAARTANPSRNFFHTTSGRDGAQDPDVHHHPDHPAA